MAVRYKKKKDKQHYVLYTIITAILVCAVFLSMVGYFYTQAKEEAYENLHVQTKQIKDNLTLQLISDRENLISMANFAGKLYSDGEDYNLMFDAFKPIGLIQDIGILSEDNTFITRRGTFAIEGRLSFKEEKKKGEYISGRVKDVGQGDYEMIRSAVPIKVKGKTVGILYGGISLEQIEERYAQMATELEAQLFVYHKETGDLVIDTVHEEWGNISFLEDREYNEGYSYEEIIATDKGFTSFESAYKNENLYLHYSTIDELGWVIALGRYDSQVFAATTALAKVLFFVFLTIFIIIIVYIIILMTKERRANAVSTCASEIRKILLEASGNQNHITEALKLACVFAKARSAVFFDTNGENNLYVEPERRELVLEAKERKYLRTELFRYATEIHRETDEAVSVLNVKLDKKFRKNNPSFYKLLKENKIHDVLFSATSNNANHITILAIINAKRSDLIKMLMEKVSACFSMALYNKNYLKKTEITATTDALTGTLNRTAYINDIAIINDELNLAFSCIYIDVNELHICNNKYGHAAGDKMLIYIANTLKDVFYGHRIYRIGGDEFLVFCQNTKQEAVKNAIRELEKQLKRQNYHVAIGVSYRAKNTNTEEMVREAEVKMYEAKARYYQNKEAQGIAVPVDDEYVQARTGIIEIDKILSVMKEKYNGIYSVSLDTDVARRILMPAYLKFNEKEEHFSNLFSKYVSEEVDTSYHRAVLSLLNYQAIKHRLLAGETPRITYKKLNGEMVALSIYKLLDTDELVSDTLWVFTKE